MQSTDELILLNCGVGEDSWGSLDCKEIQPVHPKGNQPWIFIGRTDAEPETPILWLSGVKNWLLGKAPDAGKDWRQCRSGRQRTRCLEGITASMDMSLSKCWEMVKGREAKHAAVHGVKKSQTWLNNWATTKLCRLILNQSLSPWYLLYYICFQAWLVRSGSLKSESWKLVSQSHLTLFNLMNCSLPGSSVHRALQARILEWLAISFSSGSSLPRNGI